MDTTVNPNSNRAQYLTLNIADRPTAEITKDGAGNIVAQTRYYYDEGSLLSTSSAPAAGHDYTNFGSSNTIRGNLTHVSRWNNTTSTWLDTSYTYDDLGNQRSITDPNGNTTTYDYTDAFMGTSCNTSGLATYAFRTTITAPPPLSFQSKNQYYQCSGLLASARDQNDINSAGVGTVHNYDLLNRLTFTARPDSGTTTVSLEGPLPMDIKIPCR